MGSNQGMAQFSTPFIPIDMHLVCVVLAQSFGGDEARCSVGQGKTLASCGQARAFALIYQKAQESDVDVIGNLFVLFHEIYELDIF